MNQSRCPQCGANIENNLSNCNYCGTLIESNVQVIDKRDIKSIDRVIDVLQNNISSLRNFPESTEIIITILWYYAAIMTFAVSIIFWKKPKKKFDIDEYKRLKNIVKSNIELLSLRYKHNKNVMSQINLLNNEFSLIEEKFHKKLKQRKIIIIVSIIIFILIIITASLTEKKMPKFLKKYIPKTEIYITYDENIKGNIFAIVTKTKKLKYHIYIYNSGNNKTYKVYNEKNKIFEEIRKIRRIKVISPDEIEYVRSFKGKREKVYIEWDNRKKRYINVY